MMSQKKAKPTRKELTAEEQEKHNNTDYDYTFVWRKDEEPGAIIGTEKGIFSKEEIIKQAQEYLLDENVVRVIAIQGKIIEVFR